MDEDGEEQHQRLKTYLSTGDIGPEMKLARKHYTMKYLYTYASFAIFITSMLKPSVLWGWVEALIQMALRPCRVIFIVTSCESFGFQPCPK